VTVAPISLSRRALPVVLGAAASLGLHGAVLAFVLWPTGSPQPLAPTVMTVDLVTAAPASVAPTVATYRGDDAHPPMVDDLLHMAAAVPAQPPEHASPSAPPLQPAPVTAKATPPEVAEASLAAPDIALSPEADAPLALATPAPAPAMSPPLPQSRPARPAPAATPPLRPKEPAIARYSASAPSPARASKPVPAAPAAPSKMAVDPSTTAAIAGRDAVPAVGASRAARPHAGNPPPVYPYRARQRGQQGQVVLQVRVTAAGAAEKVTVLRSSGVRALDRAALRAVRHWRFEPATRLGRPVPATLRLPVTFELRARQTAAR